MAAAQPPGATRWEDAFYVQRWIDLSEDDDNAR